MTRIQPVILCGGNGDRLWPLSTDALPKQFHRLTPGPHTMLQATALRVAEPAQFNAPFVVCLNEHRFVAAEQLRVIDITPTVFLLEPCRRNTAPAITLAAIAAREAGASYILALPCDHAIEDTAAFRRSVSEGVAASGGAQRVLFGVPPRAAHAGFGYICADEAGIVTDFVEKPAAEHARELIAQGYLWNSGIFLLPIEAFLSQLDQTFLHAVLRAYKAGAREGSFFRPQAALYEALPAVSIDQSFFEKDADARMVKTDFSWDDIGDWNAVYDTSAHDSLGNACAGPVALLDVTHSYIRSNGPIIAACGLDGFVVVAQDDAVLIAPRGQAQDVRLLLAHIRAGKLAE